MDYIYGNINNNLVTINRLEYVELRKCEIANQPIEGLNVGDFYLAFKVFDCKKLIYCSLAEMNQDIIDELNKKLDGKVDKIEKTNSWRVYGVGSKELDLPNGDSIDVSDQSIPNTLINRNANGTAQINNPVDDKDIANKQYIDKAIENIELRNDVVDIVGTYQELQSYDTSTLTANDVIKVLQDDTHDNASTYYKWNGTSFDFIGEEGPYYTQTQVDEKLDNKVDKVEKSNNWQLYGIGTESTPLPGNGGKTINASDTVLPDTVINRNKYGIAQINDPLSDLDIANKRYVDGRFDYVVLTNSRFITHTLLDEDDRQLLLKFYDKHYGKTKIPLFAIDKDGVIATIALKSITTFEFYVWSSDQSPIVFTIQPSLPKRTFSSSNVGYLHDILGQDAWNNNIYAEIGVNKNNKLIIIDRNGNQIPGQSPSVLIPPFSYSGGIYSLDKTLKASRYEAGDVVANNHLFIGNGSYVDSLIGDRYSFKFYNPDYSKATFGFGINSTNNDWSYYIAYNAKKEDVYADTGIIPENWKYAIKFPRKTGTVALAEDVDENYEIISLNAKRIPNHTDLNDLETAGVYDVVGETITNIPSAIRTEWFRVEVKTVFKLGAVVPNIIQTIYCPKYNYTATRMRSTNEKNWSKWSSVSSKVEKVTTLPWTENTWGVYGIKKDEVSGKLYEMVFPTQSSKRADLGYDYWIENAIATRTPRGTLKAAKATKDDDLIPLIQYQTELLPAIESKISENKRYVDDIRTDLDTKLDTKLDKEYIVLTNTVIAYGKKINDDDAITLTNLYNKYKGITPEIPLFVRDKNNNIALLSFYNPHGLIFQVISNVSDKYYPIVSWQIGTTKSFSGDGKYYLHNILGQNAWEESVTAYIGIDSDYKLVLANNNKIITGQNARSVVVPPFTYNSFDTFTLGSNLKITGNLSVSGTTTTVDTETLKVKDNVIVTNSDKNKLIDLSGLAINTDETNTFGIMYDPTSNTVDLGLGTIATEGKFTFNENEGLPLAIRDRNSSFTQDHLISWSTDKNKLVDSGIDKSVIDNKVDKVEKTDRWQLYGIGDKYNDLPNGKTINAESNAAPYTVINRNGSGRAKINNPIDNLDIANKQYVDNSFERKTILSNVLPTNNILLDLHNYQLESPITSDFSFIMPADASDEYLSEISFTTGPTLVAFTTTSTITFTGEDCSNTHTFVPDTNKHYNIIFWKDKAGFQAVVRGY